MYVQSVFFLLMPIHKLIGFTCVFVTCFVFLFFTDRSFEHLQSNTVFCLHAFDLDILFIELFCVIFPCWKIETWCCCFHGQPTQMVSIKSRTVGCRYFGPPNLANFSYLISRRFMFQSIWQAENHTIHACKAIWLKRFPLQMQAT